MVRLALIAVTLAAAGNLARGTDNETDRARKVRVALALAESAAKLEAPAPVSAGAPIDWQGILSPTVAAKPARVKAAEWYTADGYASARAAHIAGRGPLVMVFTSPTCVPCSKLRAEVLDSDGVRSALRGAVNVDVDVSTAEGAKLSQKCKVTTVPRVIVYRSDRLAFEGGAETTAEELIGAVSK
jgi:thiol:disulfide interchange protein